jgi:hypothetical protein
MPDSDKVHQYMEFDEDDPRFQVKILAMRVDTLTKEKEEIEHRERDLEQRVAAMERTFQRGAGAMIVIPIVGAVVGFLFAYGKIIFAPWMKSQ